MMQTSTIHLAAGNTNSTHELLWRWWCCYVKNDNLFGIYTALFLENVYKSIFFVMKDANHPVFSFYKN